MAFTQHLGGLRFSSRWKGFWDGTAEGRFLLQSCKACGSIAYPPKLICSKCGADEFEWTPSKGKGKVYTFSVVYEYPPPRLQVDLTPPYVVAIVELEEGVRVMTNIVGCPPSEVRCDMPVEVVFHQTGSEIVLPWFRPSESTA